MKKRTPRETELPFTVEIEFSGRFPVELRMRFPRVVESNEVAARRAQSLKPEVRQKFLEALSAAGSQLHYGNADWDLQTINREIRNLKCDPRFRKTGIWRIRECAHCGELLIATSAAQKSIRRKLGKLAWQNRLENKTRINEAKRRAYSKKKPSGSVRVYRHIKGLPRG